MPLADLQNWAKFLFFALSLAVAAIGTAAQASLFYINRVRLRQLVDDGVPRAEAMLKVYDEPAYVFSTILVLSSLGSAGAIGSAILLALEPELFALWGELGFVLFAFALLLIVQILARTWAVARPEATALRLVGLIKVLAWLLGPLVTPLRMIERVGLNLLGGSRVTESGAVADNELRLLVESVEDNTALEQDEREMISGIFGMSQRPVREVMTPRLDVVAEPREATMGRVLDRIIASGFSRIPIYRDDLDHVVGIAYAKDILRHVREGTLDDPIEPIARPPYFVPDTKKVDELLHDLRQKRVHMAIVIDEYGGVAGLATIEDLLEEIVGEIRDEYDVQEEQMVEQLNDREAVVDARTSLRDINDALGLHLSLEEFDTVGGLVYHELGKLPVEGDEVRVNGCLVRVVSTDGRRIKKLRVLRVDGAS